jgi:murein DD-endopeptidase MepM/ murein hydrolase activator NlpD
MSQTRYVTVMLIPEGADAGRRLRVRQWVLKAMGIGAVLLLLGIIIFFSAYSKIMVRAAMTDKLKAENEQLLRYQYKVKILEENLKDMRQIVTRLTKLAGIDYKFPEIPSDSTLFASLDNSQPVVMSRQGTDFSVPSGLPVKGFITQGFDVSSRTHYHPGVDIACAVGTPVLATASGLVIFAGTDSTYGQMLVIRHDDSTTTVYGHNDSLLVTTGQEVQAGSRIALSGNSGVSTAPHLHYEIRVNDEPINPLESPYDQEKRK